MERTEQFEEAMRDFAVRGSACPDVSRETFRNVLARWNTHAESPRRDHCGLADRPDKMFHVKHSLM
jgi:hypothetical protein